MLLLGLGIYHDILNKYNHHPILHKPTHAVHQVHERGWSISEPKRHHQNLIMTIIILESGLMHTLISNPHLMITQSQINLRKPRSTLMLVKNIINPQEWITVLHRCLI